MPASWRTLPFNLATLILLSVSAFAVRDPNSGFLLAVRSSNSAAVHEALAQGTDSNEPDKEGYTALMYSVMYGFAKTDILNDLLTHGANVNAAGHDGMTALMLACGASSGGAGVLPVKLLLEHGADPNRKNNAGYSAMMYAKPTGRQEVISLLMSKGAHSESFPETEVVTPNVSELTYNEQPVMARKEDPAEWLACEKDSECGTVMIGCYRWQSVNVAHRVDMSNAHATACSASVPAGPKPVATCTDRRCIIPVEKKECLACAETTDCTSVIVGCYRWAIVNKNHAVEMKQAGATPCKKSSAPGPQPVARCEDHRCVGDTLE